MTKFCTKCGAQNDSNAKFCEQCGAPLQQPTTADVKDSSVKAATSGAPRNPRRVVMAVLAVIGLAITGVAAWQFVSPNRPSEVSFAKVLTQHFANDKAAAEGLSCLTNTQYGRNPIYVNTWDSRMKSWMAVLVSAGLYTGPTSVVSGSGYSAHEQFKYDRTELGNKAVRDGKLCFADGVKVSKVLSFSAPRRLNGRDMTLVTYEIEFVNQAEWLKLTEVQEQAKGKVGPDALRRQATLALGNNEWEWVGDGNRLGRLSEEEGQVSSGGGIFSGIQNWFGGLFSSADPGVVVKDFYHNVERGNVDAAMAAMSSQFVSMASEEKLRLMIKGQRDDIASRGGIESIQTETKLQGDRAQVKSIIKFKNGREQKETSRLVKENGKWKFSE